MKSITRILALIILVAASTSAKAQVDARIENPDSAYTIVDAINSADGTIYIYQPQEIDRLVGRSEEQAPVSEGTTHAHKNQGYRIQVFSDNNIRTAKSNAEYRKRLVEQQTGYHAYITFDSPYWRVRVGDFRSKSEAEAAMRELRNIFPNFAADMRIVRGQISNVQ